MAAATATPATDISKSNADGDGGIVYVECPATLSQQQLKQATAVTCHLKTGAPISLFLGGGISGCPQWQLTIKQLLIKRGRVSGLVLYNPRRSSHTTNPDGSAVAFDPALSEEQIKWEHNCLHAATAIVFWFCTETLCPITLYELGAWSVHPSQKPLFIGIAPGYKRQLDIEIQTRLARPATTGSDIAGTVSPKIVYNLKAVVEQIEMWFASVTGGKVKGTTNNTVDTKTLDATSAAAAAPATTTTASKAAAATAPTAAPVPARPLKQPTREQIQSRIAKIRDMDTADAFDALLFPDDGDDADAADGDGDDTKTAAGGTGTGSSKNRTDGIFAAHFGKFLREIDGDSNELSAYLAMNHFRFHSNPDTIRQVAQRMIEHYIAEPTTATATATKAAAAGAADTLIIDLPSNVRERISEDFKDSDKFSAGLFVRAESELRDRLERDGFVRFVEDNDRMNGYVTAELVAVLNPTSSSGGIASGSSGGNGSGATVTTSKK